MVAVTYSIMALAMSALSIAAPSGDPNGYALNPPGPDGPMAITALINARKVLAGELSDGSPKTTCNNENVRVRKE
jgi:hypothetical protein